MGSEWRQDTDGLLKRFDTDTGEILEVQKTKRKAHARKDGRVRAGRVPGRPSQEATGHYHWITDGNGKRQWVPKGTNPDTLPHLVYPFSQVTCDLILQHVMEGMTLTSIGKLEGMPPVHIIFKWMRKYPEFHAEMREARKSRAEYFADRAIDLAENSKEHRVQSDRLKVDTYKWAADVNDRDTYGKHQKITGEVGGTIFHVNTGVPSEPKTIETTATPVEEEKAQ